MPKLEKTNDQWQKDLSPEQYNILREKGTEAPFTGKYNNLKEDGIFKCAGCGAQLFDSTNKFDSGTGWPSFDQAIPGAVEEKQDNSGGIIRTEAVCANCGGHLGHVFPDGPKETTCQRFCINSAALGFEKGFEEKNK
ncbi:peptide-methionine (R)-S-oxide reductase [bacterium]|nr:peptide-methionine (R)-S-oxide reductase [bacterium]